MGAYMKKNMLFLSSMLLFSFVCVQSTNTEYLSDISASTFKEALNKAIKDRELKNISDLKERLSLEKEISFLDKKIDTKFRSNQHTAYSSDHFTAKAYQEHLISINDTIKTREEKRELLESMLKRINDFNELHLARKKHQEGRLTTKEKNQIIEHYNLDY